MVCVMGLQNFIVLLGLCGAINAVIRSDYQLGSPVISKSFKLHTEPKIWRDALLVCESENAQLAVINSDEEAQIYVKEIAKHPAASLPGDFYKDSISIGIYKADNGKFVALDGTPLEKMGYSKWAAGEPSGNGEACGSIVRNGELNDVPCENTPLMFICEAIDYPESSEKTKPTCETYVGGYKYAPHRGDRFYKFHPEGKTWDEASLICQTENAKLAVINSDEEAKAYVEELKKHPDSSIPGTFSKEVIHLGFHERLTLGIWVTIDGIPLNGTGYAKWRSGQPDHTGNNEHCGSCYRDGLLNDLSCNQLSSFICEKPFASKKESHRVCPTYGELYLQDYDVLKEAECEYYLNGYKENTANNAKYFKIHWEGKTWDEALLTCQAEDATLAVINSEAESKMYAAELAKRPVESIPGDFSKEVVIVGFSDRLKPGTYTTVKGVPLSKTGFEKWAPNQPDNTNGAEHCGSIYRSGLLNDIRCDTKFHFICEKTDKDQCLLRVPHPL